MQNYESNFWSVKQYTSWPFSEKVFDDGTILDFTILAPQRILLKSVAYNVLNFSYVNGDAYASVTITGSDTVYPILANEEIVGWIHIGNWKNMTVTCNAEVLYGINITWIPIDGLSAIENGYNAEFKMDGNSTVLCSFYRGAGLGEYCGNETRYDGIYTINGIASSDYKFFNDGYITFVPEEHIFNLDMNLPDDICIRQGNKGPKGPKGPTGAAGLDGTDATEIIINFDQSC